MKKLLSVALVLLVVLAATGCSAPKFTGAWIGNRVEAGSSVIDSAIGDFADTANVEFTIDFNEDGTYVQHYYVNGKEGSSYPKNGTYTVEGGQAVLSDGSVAQIEGDGTLMLSMGNGAIKQYYSKVK